MTDHKTTGPSDDDLKKRFQELRMQDARNVPAFAKLTAARPRRVSPLVVLMPALAAAAGLLLWCGVSSTAKRAAPVAVEAPARPPPGPVAGPPAALPLDFLLESSPIRVRLDSDPTEGLRP